MIYLDKQLEFLHFLQQGRGPIMDPIFRFLNFFDTTFFAVLLVTFIWIGYSAKWGIRLGFLLITSGLINYLAKEALGLPRPPVFDPSLSMVHVRGFGFPSGGAQTSLLIGLLIIYAWKNQWAYVLGPFYTLLISFSRLFLGVHFPLDILGGWILGSLLFLAFIKTVKPIEHYSSSSSTTSLMTCLILIGFLSYLFPSFQALLLLFAAASIAIGIFISSKYHLYLKPSPRPLLGLLALASSFGLGFLIYLLHLPKHVSAMIQMVTLGLWVSLGISPLSKKIFRLR